MKLLVINPNSSKKVTDNLATILHTPPGFTLHYYTAPEAAPKEISGEETSLLSEKVVLPDLLERNAHKEYDGYLICCYLDHPLVYSLGKHTNKPIMGIMQATLLYALLNPTVKKLFILTSFNEWEPLLDAGVHKFTVGDAKVDFPIGKFQRTKALDISVLSLNDPEEFQKIVDRVDSIINGEYKGADCVLLGCAGMAGLDEKLSQKFPDVLFIDSTKIGVELLSSLVRFESARV